MKTEKSCGCIILRNKEIPLIGTRNDKNELFWSFPKGHKEPGEPDVETALRETKEEVGLDVKIIDEKPISTDYLIHDGTVLKNVSLFIAVPLNDEIKIQASEVEKAKWMPVGEAGQYFKKYYSDAWKEFLVRFNSI